MRICNNVAIGGEIKSNLNRQCYTNSTTKRENRRRFSGSIASGCLKIIETQRILKRNERVLI
ncbi:hypothetical protein OUZ56_006754 [Daphnia magna]|uniref:Uncharacterized protein n=1 Tax=Daphnia magna TaxID=35525 RepID=A0ABQ9YWL7_9CRUS|nr:hypothetical protein OUZ56_006754 [Daphnia magna]